MNAAIFASIGRLHIVAIAGLGTLTFGWLMTGQRPWLLAAVVCLDWFIVNLLNRAVDLQEDLANGITGSELVASHRGRVVIAGAGLLFGSLAVMHVIMPAITPLRLAYHSLGAAYNWPLLPGKTRLKTVYAAKNLASALGFMITLFGYNLAQMSAANTPFAAGFGWPALAISAAFFLLFEVSWEVIYDLRDAPGDRAAGVRTFAVVHGEEVAMRIADMLMIASAAALLAGWLADVIPWRLFVMIAAPVLQFALFRRFVAQGLTAAHVIGLTWLGAGLLAAYHGWIALGLPGVSGPPF